MRKKDTKKKKRRLRAILLCLVFAALLVLGNQAEVCYAYTVKNGIVNDGPVKVRKSPVDGDKIVALNPESLVTVVAEEEGTDGKTWYKIQFVRGSQTYEGYIRADFITISDNAGTEKLPEADTPQPETDVAQPDTGTVDSNVTEPNESVDDSYYETLRAAGFPDSYCTPLMALHEKYPNWQFVPVKTGLDWNVSVEKESEVGKNLIQSSVNDARKSTENGAYSWSTNTWYGFDGANWVSASKEYIAYCMDPRNYLDETYIFQFETLEYADYQNVDGVKNILKGTFMSGDYKDTDGEKRSYAETFFEIGKELSVSPYHLASRAKQEQGIKGSSSLISGNYSGYKGYYNYFNVNAYTTSNASATVNGLAYAKKMGWNSIYKSIQGGSAIVADRYVKKGQNTTYFEKFNVVNKSNLYAHQYMSNVLAAISEGSSISKAYSDKSASFLFCIPVYENMPEKAVTFSDTGNPNNWIAKLEVAGCSLTPAFKPSVTEYSVIVGREIEKVSVQATAVAKKSTIAGLGNYELQVGNNSIAVTCTSQNGAQKTYTIHVVRQETESLPDTGDAEGSEESEKQNTETTDENMIQNSEADKTQDIVTEITASSYQIGDCVSGITPGTTSETFLSNVSITNGTAKVLKADGTENGERVATGNIIALYDNSGQIIKQYETLVYGDINGDGKVSNADLVRLQKQLLKIEELSGIYSQAANVSKDEKISNKDLVMLQKHILNIEQIKQ